MKIDLTSGMSRIIKDLVDVQQRAITKLINNPNYSDEEWEILQYHDVSREELIREMKTTKQLWSEMKDEPLLVGACDEPDLSLLKHILFHIESSYSAMYREDIRSLWSLFFELDEKLKSRLKLTTNKQ